MKKRGKRLLASLLAITMLLALAACNNTSENSGNDSAADQFPQKDITLVVPYAAGGTTDLMARALTTQMGKILGVNVVVQNVEGGGGTTGTSQAVNSAADGYTLAICSNGGYLINPEVNDVGYTWDTTTPICMVSEIDTAWGVAATSPFETLQDLLDYAKANPNSITYVTPGANSTPHLHAETIALELGLQWSHAPNSSSPTAIAELIGGHVDVVCVNFPTFNPYAEDVRLLAITGEEREPSYPDVPTFAELGYDFPASVYFSIIGPADMDPAVAQILSDAVKEAMEDPTVQESFSSLEFPMSFMAGEEFSSRLADDYAMYTDALKELGVISE